MSRLPASKATLGDELPAKQVRVKRDDLVRYAGASLDFNPIHWNERFADEVGLPGVIAHGMLTMALANELVSDWVGDPGAVIETTTKFTRPVPVPNDGVGALLEITGKVTEVREDGTAKVSVTVTFEGQTVLGRPTATVKLG
ncbi:MaoC family dehydratase [Kutzneria sp. 744]|uniref:MaoC family dehydratase n=1 Tax=Kutzneria sp. (strain 744) TaxID=345341 RepID=UPI0003EEAA83|nr:MaoC family dehydratase [Kutzneria sp. 744]EWM15516.1 MaoC family protein [Kutzneria sp. 744]